MSEQSQHDKNNPEFLDDGSRPNDVIDGWAITAVLAAIVAGIVYYLQTMP